MKRIIGLVLLMAGIVLFVQGLDRKNSLLGVAFSAGTSMANSVDGGSRAPQHTIMLIGGIAVVLVGLSLTVRRA